MSKQLLNFSNSEWQAKAESFNGMWSQALGVIDFYIGGDKLM